MEVSDVARNEPTIIGAQRFSVDVVGETATPVHLKDRRTVIVICDDGDDGVKVYFRGQFATPTGEVSSGSPLQWLWHLAYHLTTVMKRLKGDTSDVTDHDVDMTLVQTMTESPMRPSE